MSEFNTRPTIETVLEAVQNGFRASELKLDAIERRLDALEAGQAKIVSEFALLRKDNRRVEEMVHVFVEQVIALARQINRGQDAA